MPYSPMHKHCTPVKNLKGKTTGLMMEGSAVYMSMLHKESEKQEKKDLLEDMPVDDKASAIEMSPYKMGHEDSPNKMGHEDSPNKMSPYKMGHEDSPASMGHESPNKMGHESPATQKLKMVKVDGKMVPEFAADGKGPNDLKKGSVAKMGHESPVKMGHKKKEKSIAYQDFESELKQQGRLQGFAEIPEGGVTRAAREKTAKFKKDISAPKANALTSNPIKFTGMSGGSSFYMGHTGVDPKTGGKKKLK